MYFVDVLNSLAIHPDDGDNVEEGLPLGEVLRLSKDSGIDIGEKHLDNTVILFEGHCIVPLEVAVDGLEELNRVVDYLVTGAVEVHDAHVYNVHHELYERRTRNLFDIAP